MLTGLSFLAVITKIMVNQVEGVFGYDKNVYIAKTVSEREGRKRPKILWCIDNTYLHMSHGRDTASGTVVKVI